MDSWTMRRTITLFGSVYRDQELRLSSASDRADRIVLAMTVSYGGETASVVLEPSLADLDNLVVDDATEAKYQPNKERFKSLLDHARFLGY